MANNGLSPLTPEDVLAIYTSEGRQQDIANAFSVSRVTVSHIKRGYAWTSVTGHARTRTYTKAPT